MPKDYFIFLYFEEDHFSFYLFVKNRKCSINFNFSKKWNLLRSRANYRELVSKSMKCRRRRQDPFKSTSNSLFFISSPRIICTFRSMCKSQVYNVEKVNKTHSAQVRSVRTYNIPTLKCIGVVKITTRHPCKTLKVLRKECLIYSNEKQEKLCLTMVLWILASSEFTYPKIEGSKDTRNSTHTQYIMKMRNNIISIMQCNINTCVCKNNPCQSTNCKQNQKAQSKQHGGCLPQTSSILGS